MYIPNVSLPIDRRSMITTSTPLNKSSFTLDTSGVSGFFGGEEAVSAMATVHIYRGRRWLGWYNTPGSYQIAKRYGLVAKSSIFKGLFPDVRTDVTKLFALDGLQGPRFHAVKSGTIMNSTGHLAAILMTECASMASREIRGRNGPNVSISIVTLQGAPPTDVAPRRTLSKSPFLAIIPILTSLAACIVCGAYGDWFSSSLILLGMLSNGVSCLVIGSGTLHFMHHNPAAGSPPGDGILGCSGNEFVVLQGEEGAVNSITRGKFSIKFPHEHYEEYIGCCSIFLTIQFVSQLFLIPQGSLFGQIMFTLSLAVSWTYNMWLSAFDRESIQRHILLDVILKKPSLVKYTLTTRTAAAVFAVLVLSPDDPSSLLNTLLPNDTKAWRKWKGTVLQRIPARPLHFDETDWNLEGYTEEERKLLCVLYGDAKDAYDGWREAGSPGKLETSSSPTPAPTSTEPSQVPGAQTNGTT